MDFKTAHNYFLPQLKTTLQTHMAPPTGAIDPFYGMMHYHLGWVDRDFNPVETSPGKQLRPLFTLLVNQALGGDLTCGLIAGGAVELIHNFSLVHDDIQDQSLTRRGRETVWAIWGEAQAINSGDAMFTLARNLLLKLADCGLPAEITLAALQAMDETSLTLCRGQYLDMSFETADTVPLDDYLTMIAGKTSSLIGCAGYLGALVATQDMALAERFRSLGVALGSAFQMQDDLLGIWGDEALTGKPAGDDLRRKKQSLPVVYAMAQAAPQANQLRAIYRQDTLTDADVATAIELLDTLGARRYVEAKADTFIKDATAILQTIDAPDTDKQPLLEMAEFMVKRAF